MACNWFDGGHGQLAVLLPAECECQFLMQFFYTDCGLDGSIRAKFYGEMMEDTQAADATLTA